MLSSVIGGLYFGFDWLMSLEYRFLRMGFGRRDVFFIALLSQVVQTCYCF